MKKILPILLCVISVCTYARDNHYIGFTAGADYTLNPEAGKQSPRLNGVNGDIDFVYQLRHRHFLFMIGVGGNMNYNQVNIPLKRQIWEQIFDTDGDKCDLYFDFNPNRTKTTEVAFSAPILMGGQWGGIYFMAGAKLRVKVWNQTHITSEYTIQAQYPFYNSLLHDMPEHYLVSNIANNETVKNTTMRFLGAVTGEIGVDVTHYAHYKKAICKLGLYVDYTPNLQSAAKLAYNSSNYIGNTTEMLYNSTEIPTQWRQYVHDKSVLQQIGIGLKLTVLFKMPEVVRNCRCADWEQ